MSQTNHGSFRPITQRRVLPPVGVRYKFIPKAVYRSAVLGVETRPHGRVLLYMSST